MKTSIKLVKWFAHKNISWRPIKPLKKLLQNWSITDLLSNELQNVTDDCISVVCDILDTVKQKRLERCKKRCLSVKTTKRFSPTLLSAISALQIFVWKNKGNYISTRTRTVNIKLSLTPFKRDLWEGTSNRTALRLRYDCIVINWTDFYQ